MRAILDDVRSEMATSRYRVWAASHEIDDGKVHMELAGKRRPTAGSPYARLIIEAIRVALGAVTPPPLPLSELGRNVMFTAWNPAAALRCPPHWKIALSADPAYDAAARAAAPKVKAHGNPLAVWGVQTQIGTQRIKDFARDVGADFLIFQAETVDEYDTAIAAGASMIVGNPNSWTQAQRDDAINREGLATLFEVYANAGSPWPDTASSRGVPVVSEVLGVGWGPSPFQLADYLPHTPAGVWATIGVYLAENMSEESWGLLP